MFLITGASGFIGQHLVKEFHDDGVFVASEKNMNLKDADQIEQVVREVQPEVVIHLGAKTEVAYSFDNYLEVSSVNYVGTVALAEACHRFNPKLKHFILASTMETYGRQKVWKPFTEETPQFPDAPYAVAKVAAEKYLDYMGDGYGFPYTILRQTNSYGRHDNEFFVVERIITQMLRGDVCRLGAPSPIRNFLYIDDLVRLYRAVVEQRPLYQTFVTGPDNALSIRDLAQRVRDILGWTGRIEWNTQPPRPGEVYYLNSNPAKARDWLGWEPEIDLDRGLKLTIDKWL